jgi:hypothetical protein
MQSKRILVIKAFSKTSDVASIDEHPNNDFELIGT